MIMMMKMALSIWPAKNKKVQKMDPVTTGMV
jgi:hypothetical protein